MVGRPWLDSRGRWRPGWVVVAGEPVYSPARWYWRAWRWPLQRAAVAAGVAGVVLVLWLVDALVLRAAGWVGAP